jgi:hypothetical protein
VCGREQLLIAADFRMFLKIARPVRDVRIASCADFSSIPYHSLIRFLGIRVSGLVSEGRESLDQIQSKRLCSRNGHVRARARLESLHHRRGSGFGDDLRHHGSYTVFDANQHVIDLARGQERCGLGQGRVPELHAAAMLDGRTRKAANDRVVLDSLGLRLRV